MNFDDIRKATVTSVFDPEPKKEDKIYLNGTYSYVVKNIMIDNEEETATSIGATLEFPGDRESRDPIAVQPRVP